MTKIYYDNITLKNSNEEGMLGVSIDGTYQKNVS